MEQDAFLGSGMKFPPQVNQGTGRFMASSGRDSVKESVYLILMTNKGERWLEPGFGSRMMSYTFMDTTLTMFNLMSNDLRSAILEQEPRISDVDIAVEPESNNGCLIVNVTYTIAATNSRDNLVFPFYLSGSPEIDTQ